MLTTKRVVFIISLLFGQYTITAETSEQQDEQFQIPKKGDPCCLPSFATTLPQDVCRFIRGIRDRTLTNNVLLLHGPAGNGKSTLAKLIVKLAGAEEILIESSKLTTPFVGNASYTLSQEFDTVEQQLQKDPNKTYVMIIEEIDDIAFEISSSPSADFNKQQASATKTLWRFMDKHRDSKRIIFIFTTNRFELLDSRFSTRLNNNVELKNPTDKEREEIFKYYLGASLEEKNLNNLVEKTKGHGNRLIKNVCQAALEEAEGSPITHESLLKALEKAQNTIHDPESLKRAELIKNGFFAALGAQAAAGVIYILMKVFKKES